MKPSEHKPHPTAKLTPETVRRVRSSVEPGKVFAINLQVSESTISRIRSGRRWGWLR